MNEHPGKDVIAEIQAYLDRRMAPMGAPFPMPNEQFRDIASYVSDLEARLEKAEAERDSAEEARLGAYEVCAVYAYCHADDRPRRYAADYNGFSMDYDDGYMDGCKGAAAAIRAISPLHASPPTPDQGDGA